MALRGDSERRSLYGQGIKMMVDRNLRADPGQLLITLDAYEFSRFMRRYRSDDYGEHAAMFEATATSEQAAQWDNAKAKRRSAG